MRVMVAAAFGFLATPMPHSTGGTLDPRQVIGPFPPHPIFSFASSNLSHDSFIRSGQEGIESTQQNQRS